MGSPPDRQYAIGSIMDGLITIGILLLLMLPGTAIAALIMVLGLRRRVAALEARLAVAEGGEAALAVMPAPATSISAAAQTPDLSRETKEKPARPTVAKARKTRESLEHRLGARWAVWVGGLALALGALFLVRYSIDAGLIGPGARIALGLAFSLALLAAGEMLRRAHGAAFFASPPNANIPAILTAAGTVGLFASIYAAYALYAMIGPLAAFFLLAMVGLACMAAAALHGPWLSGLGLIGAHAAPALVATASPDTAILAPYLLIVTGAAFLLAMIRQWRWLPIAAAAAAALWGFIMLGLPGGPFVNAAYGLALVALTLALALPRRTGPASPKAMTGVILTGLAALLVAGVAAADATAMPVLAALLAMAMMLAAAWRRDAAALAAPVAAALLLGLLFVWPATSLTMAEPAASFAGILAHWFPRPGGIIEFIGTAGIGIMLLIGTGVLHGRAEHQSAVHSIVVVIGTAVAGPLLGLAMVYLRLSGLVSNPLLAVITAALAACYAAAADGVALGRQSRRSGDPIVIGILAAGAVAGFAFALTMLLSGGILTTAFALASLGTAAVETRRPIAALRHAVLGLALAVFVRLAYDPTVFGYDSALGIHAAILVGYGIPALAFAGAAALLRRRAVDRPALAAEAVSVVLVVLLVIFEIRAAIFGDNLMAAQTNLAEQGLYTAAAFAFALGLTRLGQLRRTSIFAIAALLARAIGLFAEIFSLGIAVNPIVTGIPVAGSAFANEIVLAYGLPAVLAALVAMAPIPKDARPWQRHLRTLTGLVALALALLGLTLEIRFLFAGPNLLSGPIGSAESYTYSAAWLFFGLLVLLSGLLLDAKAARFASAIIILITVLKVFLFDMAHLEGIWRALSFMGLGIVMIVIGLLYQHLLFGPARRGPASTA